MYIDKILVDASLSRDGTYIAELPAVRQLKRDRELAFTSDVTIFVGENGSGKSTLLEALAICAGFNAEGGSKNFNFATRPSESGLHQYFTILKRDFPKDGYFLRAESFYNVATEIENRHVEQTYGGSLHLRSHGESFLDLVTKRFWGNGLYILDEPEAALSPSRQLSLLAEFHRLVQEHSQLIIATHSPILLAYPGADIRLFDEEGIRSVRYQETEHYQLTKRFLDCPERMLSILFDENA